MASTILSDNGVSSGSAGIKTSGGNDGVLALQTTTAGGTATTAMTIDTTQQVGINRVPSAGGGPLQVGFDSSANAGVRIQTTNASTAGEILNFINSSNTGAGKVIFGTSQTSVAYQTTTAGQSTGAVLQNSGIAFPASQVASADANTLDDYEEGTWTPVATPNGAGTLTSYASSGTYTKVGRIVSIVFYVQLTNAGTASGALNISGLPFTAANLSYPNGNRNAVGLGREDAVTGVIYQFFPQGATNNAQVQSTAGGAIVWTTNYNYVFSCCYTASA